MAGITYKLVAHYPGADSQVKYFATKDELLKAIAKAEKEGAVKVESGPLN